MSMKKNHLIHALLLACSVVNAADIPKPGTEDPRVRFVDYQPHDVTVVRVQRGTVTRINFASDEQILFSVSGLSARCDNDADEWCISSNEGSNQVIVRPKDRATRNNLELRTNKRDYSLEFDVLPDPLNDGKKKTSLESSPFYRVVFRYPADAEMMRRSVVAGLLGTLEPPGGVRGGNGGTQLQAGTDSPADVLKAQPPTVRNSNYSMQILPGGEDAAPTTVFDDGRFTYFEFLGAREIPSIFSYGSDGEATRVNWHMQPPFVVAQRTARKFTLRIGGSVVGVFNESFDSVGIDTPTNTVSKTVIRETKEIAK